MASRKMRDRNTFTRRDAYHRKLAFDTSTFADWTGVAMPVWSQDTPAAHAAILHPMGELMAMLRRAAS
jgi:hypothetical protein